MKRKCKNCGHLEDWHYGKEIGNPENDCRCIYNNRGKTFFKGCMCEKFEPEEKENKK